MKRILLAGFALLGLTIGVMWLQPVSVYAGSAKEEVCKGIGAASGSTSCAATGVTLEEVVNTVVNLLSIIIGIVAVIMIMVGGFKYVTANGDSGNLNSAKTTIIYAIIGLVIVALAQFIVQFVVSRTLKGNPEKKDSYIMPDIAFQKRDVL